VPVLEVRLADRRGTPAVLAVGVAAGDGGDSLALLPHGERADAAAFLADVEHRGAAGVVHALPRPNRTPRRLLFVGVGEGDETGWRAAGAALARAARGDAALTVAVPADLPPVALGALAEGLWLASYRFRLTAAEPDKAPKLRRVTVVTGQADRAEPARDAMVARARAVAEATVLARDLANTPSDQKSPAWFARQVEKAAGVATARPGSVTVTVRAPQALADEGFGAILAVGGGSVRGPRLVEVAWRPRASGQHVVLVGKGITFDTGGICIKTRDGMKLMRKDMSGAAAAVAAAVGAAALGLPVRVTALAPLAENMLGADAYRPGDVVRHYGGLTSEVLNTDAEGRLVMADAIAYATRRLRPDVIVDLATLTGAQGVALGKRTAALYSENDTLADALVSAGAAVGESLWRMPLVEDYVDELRSDVADLVNFTDIGAGSVAAALYLREFAGPLRDRWVHVDMSSASWADRADAELAKGATGWGVRTLLRWLERFADAAPERLSAASQPAAVRAR
jgi:leucyl aminopeptidase